ncbi:hypothetical protein JW721_03360 [Candidatus Micrarchaeota archaeon]|nr:hypothetical protein [Candidatus Micrarchaeota archaeon]
MGKVKLFVEGVGKRNQKQASEMFGFPVTPIENGKIKELTNTLALLSSVSRLNAFLWGIGNQDIAGKFIGETIAEMAKVIPAESQNMEAFLTIMLKDFGHTSVGEIPGVEIGDSERQGIADDLIDNSAKGVTGSLRELLEKIGKIFTAEGIRETLEGAKAEIEDGFAALGVKAKVGVDISSIAIPGKEALAEQNPVEIAESLEKSYGKLKVLREMGMAKCICEAEFDFGVLNIGYNHISSRNFMGLLNLSGIESMVAGEQKRA